MPILASVLKAAILANFLLVAFLSSAPPAWASTCGPGTHWVDVCAPSTDNFRVELAFGIDETFDNIPEYNVSFFGTATISHGVPQAFPEDPLHPVYVPIEIVGMSLIAGPGPLAGTQLISGTANGMTQNPEGYLSEQSDPTLATAHIDYFFEIRDTPFGTLHHESGKTLWVQRTIGRYPRYDIDFRHTGCCFGTFIDILDQNETPVFRITDLVDTNGILLETQDRPMMIFQPVPIGSGFPLFLSGLTALWLKLRRAHK